MGKRYLPIGKRASVTTTISKNPFQANFNEAELAITDVGFTENTRKKQKMLQRSMCLSSGKTNAAPADYKSKKRRAYYSYFLLKCMFRFYECSYCYESSVLWLNSLTPRTHALVEGGE